MAMILKINSKWCKGCGVCVSICPKQALSLGKNGKAEHDPEKCIDCGMCELYCPDLAIQIEGETALSKAKGA